jgi:Flp pilus assembly CpaE family ATPase
MTGRPSVILALTPLAEREIESLLFDASDAPLTLVSSVAEADDLQRAVEQEAPDAVLLSPELSGLTAGHCARVRASGARLVGLALDEREREALAVLSVDATIDSTVSRDDLLAAVRGTVSEAQPATPAPAPARPERREDAGSILAVVGAKGAPGASECAASLAALAARSWPTVLVEIDALGGGLDVRLGADATLGSLLGLIRAVSGGGGVQRELVERWLVEPAAWPAVLLGPPDPQALIELARPGAMTRALHALASLYPLTVCDVGAFLADGHAAGALHREAVIGADAVLLVLGARDTQLRHGLRQFDLLLGTLAIPPERLRVIANAIGAPGTASRSAITQTITAHLAERGVTVDAWLPWDARGLARAQRRGAPLATARQRSRYSRAMTRLLQELFLPATPTPTGRKRRLVSPRQAPNEEQVVWQP